MENIQVHPGATTSSDRSLLCEQVKQRTLAQIETGVTADGTKPRRVRVVISNRPASTSIVFNDSEVHSSDFHIVWSYRALRLLVF